MQSKLSVLRDCRRLLRPDGRLAFLTIEVVPGLDPERHAEAVESGPPAVEGPEDLTATLREVGFVDVARVDLTAEYLRTQREWFEQWQAHRGQLVDIVGAERVQERQEERVVTARAIDAGLLRRSLYVARRP